MATMADILRRGFAGAANYWLNRPKEGGASRTRQEVLAEVGVRYPPGEWRAVEGALDRVIEGRKAGRNMEALGPDGILKREDVPDLPGLESGYEYWVRLQCINPRTDRETFPLLVIHEPRGTSARQLAQRIDELASRGQSFAGLRGGRSDPHVGEICGVTIEAVYRAR